MGGPIEKAHGMSSYTIRQFNHLPSPEDAYRLFSEISDTDACHRPRPADKPLVLYGCGDLGRMAKTYLDRIGIRPILALDATPERYQDNGVWKKIPVKHADAVSEEIKSQAMVAVSIVNYPYLPLHQYLQSCGWNDCIPFYDIAESYRSRHPLSNGWFAGSLSASDVDGISSVLNNWSDDVSRAHHLQFLAWRRLREEWSFEGAPVISSDRYFIQEICCALKPNDSFADIGAHTGSVSKRFIKCIGANLNQVWAIEPDPDNLSRIRQWQASLPAHQADRIQVMPVAVGRHEARKRFFFGLGYASQLSQMGQEKLKIVPIDSLRIEPDFIKFHLEGSELDALKGSKRTIIKNRPIIVATTYHNALGLWELPSWLMRTLENYHILMRVHSWCGTGAVVYCIPAERWIS
jgi:FkbM family methyltransferase